MKDWMTCYIEPRRLLAALAMPFILAASVATVVLVWHIFELPPDTELMEMAKHFFDTYGYLAIFLAAILEGALVVGLYFPGAIAIALTAWDINVASFTATAAGTLRYPYGRFLAYTLLAFLVWNSFWATIIYFIGREALEFTGGNYTYPVIALTVWILIVTGKHILENMRGELREAPAALD